MNPNSYDEFFILYVDDEAQSLKYFPKLFPAFRILTAEGVQAARKVIAEHGDYIAVVISDQRMPDGSGTELLSELRRMRPEIIRILTTAYSDLDSAIAAVNSGAVYRYVVKPWEQADLRQTLMRAYEFFGLQRDRNRLLREKISVLQRMILLDRVRSFAVLAAGLANRIKYPLEALRAFLDAAPPPPENTMRTNDVQWDRLWKMAQQESQGILETIHGVVQRTIEPAYHFQPIDFAKVLAESLEAVSERGRQRGVTVELEPIPSDLPTIKADVHMLQQMLSILPQRLSLVDPEAKVIRIGCHADEVWGQPGVRISVVAAERDWSTIELHNCFSMVSPQGNGLLQASSWDGDLLAAYFIAYHHGGTMSVRRTTPMGPGFVASFPADPEAVTIPGVDAQWLERTFTWLDA
jgi:two-component system, probable response regulator PhcQ